MNAQTAMACPGCAALPVMENAAVQAGGTILSLPGIHCALCISQVERTLSALPGVRDARVNLSRKRVRVDAPGIAPQVLIDTLAQAGHAAQELDTATMMAVETDAAGRALLTRIAVAGFAMMNVMLFSVAVWSGAADSTRILFHWISAGIAVPALLFSAQVFFSAAWAALRVGRLNMDVPISLAIILACAMSIYETAMGSTHVYFDAALSLTFFLLLGRYLDHRMRVAARSAAQELAALELPRAVRVRDGVGETVALAALRLGDLIHVAAGMRLPVDGRVTEGHSQTDRSLVTGESLPASVAPGDILSAGEVNLHAPLLIEATAVGEDTTLRRMAALVETAEQSRNRYTALADRAAAIYAPAVHLLALLAFIGWYVATGEVARSLNIAIAVLIITCPCALGLAVPAVMTAASGRLFRAGLLVKNATALERLAEVDTVIFDKTGTLTQGRATANLSCFGQDALAVLAALAGQSAHPVSRAIMAVVPTGTLPARLTDVLEIPGKGIQASWNGQRVRLGRGDWVGGTPVSPALRIREDAPLEIAVDETLRSGATEAIDILTQDGFALHLMSGDAPAPVARIAQTLGIRQHTAQMRPEDKQAQIAALTDAGARVLMIGDGLNDTGALAQAHASISPACALDASRAASDIVLLGPSLAAIPDAIATARSARARVLENFAIAAGYNMIAIPVALSGMATPLAAAIAMSLSSLTVLFNALRLR